MQDKPRKYTPQYKFDLVIETLKGDKSANDIALENDLNPNVLSQWKQQFLKKSPSIFENNIKHRPSNKPVDMDGYMVKIRKLRENSNMSQEQVAQYLGTSQTMYARYENGASKMPIRHLIMLVKLYGVSADYILGIEEE